MRGSRCKVLGLRSYLDALARDGLLTTVAYPCSPNLEIGEIAHRVLGAVGSPHALLFSNPRGYRFPVAINLYASSAQMLSVLRGSGYSELSRRVDGFIMSLLSMPHDKAGKLRQLRSLRGVASILPRVYRGHAPSQQESLGPELLDLLPALQCWPADGGRFLTLPMVITEDPETHVRNVGMYRAQLLSRDRLALHWHVHKTGARHFRAYAAQGKRMPVAIALGGDPLLAYCATAPLPEGIDEWLLAGFLRQAPVRLVRAKTVPLMVPAEADFVIEGYVDPKEPPVLEGPFGDHTGFYSLPDYYPSMRVTTITHRADAVYPATIVGVPPMEDAEIAEATASIFKVAIARTVAPELVDFALPSAGCSHNLAIVAVRTEYPGQAERLANLLWSFGQLMFTKFVVVVDADVDPHDAHAVLRAVASNVRNVAQFYFGQGPLDVLEHASLKACEGGKLMLDARRGAHQSVVEASVSLRPIDETEAHVAGLDVWVGERLLARFARAQSGGQSARAVYGLGGVQEHPLLFVVVDQDISLDSPYLLLWYSLASVAPEVDCELLHEGEAFCLLVDARMKAGRLGRRPWPNVVASDRATVERVDDIFPQLNLGSFLDSPSRTLQAYQRGQEALAKVD